MIWELNILGNMNGKKVNGKIMNWHYKDPKKLQPKGRKQRNKYRYELS